MTARLIEAPPQSRQRERRPAPQEPRPRSRRPLTFDLLLAERPPSWPWPTTPWRPLRPADRLPRGAGAGPGGPVRLHYATSTRPSASPPLTSARKESGPHVRGRAVIPGALHRLAVLPAVYLVLGDGLAGLRCGWGWTPRPEPRLANRPYHVVLPPCPSTERGRMTRLRPRPPLGEASPPQSSFSCFRRRLRPPAPPRRP